VLLSCTREGGGADVGTDRTRMASSGSVDKTGKHWALLEGWVAGKGGREWSRRPGLAARGWTTREIIDDSAVTRKWRGKEEAVQG
jgi:hypothetical protein